MSRTAFSLWNERIAPVFDVARNLLIVDAEEGVITGRLERRFSSDSPQERTLRLSSLQINYLVCGAISRTASDALQQGGIQVLSFVSGEIEQVIQAWLNGHIRDGHLDMPGCGRRNKHGAGRGRRGK